MRDIILVLLGIAAITYLISTVVDYQSAQRRQEAARKADVQRIIMEEIRRSTGN